MPPSRVGPHSQLSFGSRWPCGERTSAICLTISFRERDTYTRGGRRASRPVASRHAGVRRPLLHERGTKLYLKLPRAAGGAGAAALVSQSGIFAKGLRLYPCTVFPSARAALCERSCPRRALTATSTTHVPVPAMVPAELTAALAAPGGRALRLRPLRSRLSHTAHRPHRKKQGPGRPRDPTGPRRRESRYCRYAIKVKAP